MNVRRIIGRLLAVVVIAGLAFAPLVTPAAAKRLAVSEMTDMSAMSKDMPCCPNGHKIDGCKDCPLLAVCMLTVAQAQPTSASGVGVIFKARRLSYAFYDSSAASLVGAPPDHPPRISI